MTDRERITTLLRQGLSADAIAAILNTDLATVQDVQEGAGGLPAAGGLVVGAWEDYDYLGFPTTPDVLAFDVLDVPCEIEVEWVPTAGAFGGFYLKDAGAVGFVAFVTKTTSGDPALTSLDQGYLRSIIPAGAQVELHWVGSETWHAGVTMQNVRRRTLG